MLSLLLLIFAPNVDLPEIRQLFTMAADDKEACDKLFELKDGYTLDYKPVVYAYHAAAEMTHALLHEEAEAYENPCLHGTSG